MRKLIRLNEVLTLTAYPRSTLYQHINDGLFPPQLTIGNRSIAFVEEEVEALIQARIAGKSNEELRKLVADLKSNRSEYSSKK
ncbi:helix-turn-helix transcriptional regulator [Thalassotalea maritima]|uniref:helix-turn-helix transcriptional regulator n=1 Tax=Thalassotalea maritima TaxID=3242416 RepID=UPI00352981F3